MQAQAGLTLGCLLCLHGWRRGLSPCSGAWSEEWWEARFHIESWLCRPERTEQWQKKQETGSGSVFPSQLKNT